MDKEKRPIYPSDLKFLNRIKEVLNENLQDACLSLNPNSTSVKYNSIIISAPSNVYRGNSITQILFSRVYNSPPKMAFSYSLAKPILELYNIPYKLCKISSGKEIEKNASIKKEDILVSFDFDSFENKEFSAFLQKMFLACFNFTSFGCCSKYIDCSDVKKCLHDDQLYSTACQYRKNLELGNIFYGKSKNIE